jgi:hypothetical protein
MSLTNDVLLDATLKARFLEFAEDNYAQQNVLFWLKLFDLRKAEAEGEKAMRKVMAELYKEFLDPMSPQEVILSGKARRGVLKGIGSVAPRCDTPPVYDLSLFDKAMNEVEQQLRTQLYQPFLASLEGPEEPAPLQRVRDSIAFGDMMQLADLCRDLGAMPTLPIRSPAPPSTDYRRSPITQLEDDEGEEAEEDDIVIGSLSSSRGAIPPPRSDIRTRLAGFIQRAGLVNLVAMYGSVMDYKECGKPRKRRGIARAFYLQCLKPGAPKGVAGIPIQVRSYQSLVVSCVL